MSAAQRAQHSFHHSVKLETLTISNHWHAFNSCVFACFSFIGFFSPNTLKIINYIHNYIALFIHMSLSLYLPFIFWNGKQVKAMLCALKVHTAAAKVCSLMFVARSGWWSCIEKNDNMPFCFTAAFRMHFMFSSCMTAFAFHCKIMQKPNEAELKF